MGDGLAGVKRMPKADEPEAADDPMEERAEGEDPMAAARAQRAQRYLTQGAGVNQGDQAGDTARSMEEEARKAYQGGSPSGRGRAADLREQAQKLRGGY